jgi:hypothetical protein
MAEREAWYVLETGDVVHPADVSVSEVGRLIHERGLVAMRSADCPMTRNVDPDEMVDLADADGEKQTEEPQKRQYKTRVMKAKR